MLTPLRIAASAHDTRLERSQIQSAMRTSSDQAQAAMMSRSEITIPSSLGKRPNTQQPADDPYDDLGEGWHYSLSDQSRVVAMQTGWAAQTPSRPMPTSGKLAAITALPQPPKVSQKVPMPSATHL